MLKTDRMAAADLITGIGLILFGGVLILASLNMKIYKTFLDAPGFFPFILGIIFIGLGIVMTSSSLHRKGYQQIIEGLRNFNFVHVSKSVQFQRVMVLIFLMAFYIFILIDRINFTLATALYLFFTLSFLKSAGPIKIILISIVAAFMISTFFVKFFHIPLP